MSIRAEILAEIAAEREQRSRVDRADVLARLAVGGKQAALHDLFFFLAPGDALWCLEQVRARVAERFRELDADQKKSLLILAYNLALGLGSMLPHWNLVNASTWDAAALRPEQLWTQARAMSALVGELASQVPDLEESLLGGLRAQALLRLVAEKASDPAGQAGALCGNSLQDAVGNHWEAFSSSNMARMARLRFAGQMPTVLGNDYASFLPYAIYLGASYATTNPVIVLRAWDTEPSRWSAVVDGLIAENPRQSADELARRFTLEVALDNMRLLRPLFLLSDGYEGLVCLQVDPRRHDDPEAMVAYATKTYCELAERLGGGRPNVVFKLPGTKAGLEACSALTQQGIGVTITLNFALFQHIPFAQVLAQGQAVVSYLVEMNGRLAYPVRDELAAKSDELLAHGITECQAREAAAWAGVAVLKRLHTLMAANDVDAHRIQPLVASLRIYEGEGYEQLPSKYPDITESLGTGVISIFPDVRYAFDGEEELSLASQQLAQPVNEGVLAILRQSEIFRQAYYVADRTWLPEGDDAYQPTFELTLSDEEAVVAWPPIRDTLDQFMASYESLCSRIAGRM